MGSKGKNALVLFAREPVFGKVKTRLQSLLDPETTLKLYACFLWDCLDKICSIKDVDPFIGVYPEIPSAFFEKAKRGKDVGIFAQKGGDLGERMKNAFIKCFDDGYKKVAIIGSDSPTLPASYIMEAFNSDREVVIGPTVDSGYYLVGMNRGITDIFGGVSWGTEKVLPQTLERLREKGAGLKLLPLWYDVDLPEDLKFMKIHMDLMSQGGMGLPEATAEFLDQLKL